MSGDRILTRVYRTPRAAWAVLASGVVVTASIAWAFNTSLQQRDFARFENAVQGARDRIEARLETYVALLRATAGLHAAGSGTIDCGAFRRYFARVDLGERYPGIQGIGFAKRLLPENRVVVEEAARAFGFGDFRVWAEGGAEPVTAIVCIEPLDSRNRAALGFDMFSEGVRRAAMERAWRTGAPAMSAGVTLKQEIRGPKQPGFLLYLPVYRRGTIPASEAERLRELDGFVYMPFRAHDLFQGIFGHERKPQASFRLYDGSPATEHLLYDSAQSVSSQLDPHAIRVNEPLDVAGRTWILEFASTEHFYRAHGVAPTVASVGLAVSLLFFVLARSHILARRRAEQSEQDLRYLLEERQRLLAQAEEAVATRDEFLSIASHELKTPIATLVLQAHTIAKLASKQDSVPGDTLANKMAVVLRQTARLAAFVEDLLDVSHIRSGRFEVHPQPIDMALLVREEVERLDPMLKRADCPVVLDSPHTLMACADPVRVRQILDNLLSNAGKYGSGRPIAVRISADAEHALLAVADQGIGIPEEDQARIFERFERAVASQHYGGLGLGLWITKKLVEAMGGEIAVQSRPGQGSTFVVRLPQA